ncbi:restriction endonuclease [Bacillus sp. Au-Bac7]|uniref:restriction endonuclease n=1 Tax=Bacillus sp. Au-Bac7 TaxID=2906458 RepID=UPI001E29806C|nr:restriction endonuclease [Bacillus sp. Au-Bac7]MCE4051859.1 restriction endonuclease [Bacillus sp. Au-Bac7]
MSVLLLIVLIGVLIILCVVKYPYFIIRKIGNTRTVYYHVKFMSKYERDNFIVSTANLKTIKKKLGEVDQKYQSYSLDYYEEAVKYAIDTYIFEDEVYNFNTPTSFYRIDIMTGTEFEQFLKEVFQEKGYDVESTKASGDQGVDLILRKSGRKIAVQAKRYKNKISNSAVQEISTGKIFYDCNEAYVVTNSYFTQPAINLANKVNVKLVDRRELVRLITHKHVDL